MKPSVCLTVQRGKNNMQRVSRIEFWEENGQLTLTLGSKTPVCEVGTSECVHRQPRGLLQREHSTEQMMPLIGFAFSGGKQPQREDRL